jgi:uncharacterized protein YbjT (DUF2867 family)
MTGTARTLLVSLLLAVTCPALAQKTTEPQPMAAPGESTEPPSPKAAPAGAVEAVPLPRSGGVLVFGGTRGTGLEAVKTLVAMKEQVTVVTHGSPDNAELKAMGVTVVSGNVLDPDSIKEVFKSTPFRAVISTIGRQKNQPSPDFDGNKNVIDAAKATGIPRFILVSTIGAGDSEKAAPWIARLFLKEVMAEKGRAEDYLKASGLDYTIVRPGGLLDKPASGQARLVADPMAFSFVARADLGKLVAECVKNDDTIKKTLSVLDPTRTGILSLFGAK